MSRRPSERNEDLVGQSEISCGGGARRRRVADRGHRVGGGHQGHQVRQNLTVVVAEHHRVSNNAVNVRRGVATSDAGGGRGDIGHWPCQMAGVSSTGLVQDLWKEHPSAGHSPPQSLVGRWRASRLKEKVEDDGLRATLAYLIQ